MFLAYKYAKKRYRAHQEAKLGAQPAVQTTPSGQYGMHLDDTRGLTASSDDPSIPAPYDPAALAAKPVRGSSDEGKPKETPEEQAEKKHRRKYRLRIILGLFLPFTLQALDTTIIASALKFIADDFSQSLLASYLPPHFPLHPSHRIN